MEAFSNAGKENASKEEVKKHRTERFMKKLFKEKKEPTSQDEVDSFLRGPSDQLYMTTTPSETDNPFDTQSNQPPLARLDTATASRWPSAAKLASIGRRRSQTSPHPSKRNRKGLVVRFTEEKPEVIGEGGDEAESPVEDIGMRKRAHSHPALRRRSQEPISVDCDEGQPPEYGQPLPERAGVIEALRPGPPQHSQSGFKSLPEIETTSTREDGEEYSYGLSLNIPGLSSESNRRSFAEMVKAEMGSGEGEALKRALSNTSSIEEQLAQQDSSGTPATIAPRMDELHLNTIQNTYISPTSPGIPPKSPRRSLTPNDPHATEYFTESPAALSRPATLRLPSDRQSSQRMDSPSSTSRFRQESNTLTESPASPPTLSRAPTFTIQDAAIAVGDDALQEFSRRTNHLSTLFRLSTEASKPISRCSLEDIVRAALWWFLKGRLNLEATIRARPTSPRAQHSHQFQRQQSWADLAKALWLADTVASQFPETKLRPGSPELNASLSDILEARQGLLSSLRKLTMSMKRNNFLPPEETPLTQGLDASIWVKDDGTRSLLALQRSTLVRPTSETLPLGDTSKSFHYGRGFVQATLLEEGDSQEYHCPALVSLSRGQKERCISAIISSQDGALSMLIQSDKSRGLNWEDVRWRTKHNMVEIKLPRGFLLRLRCSEQDYRLLWGTYDYERKTHENLALRAGEVLVFETVVRSFQYFDQTGKSNFPKDPQSQCHVRVFEQSIVEKAATGPRTLHRGFRLGLNTSPKTKNLMGIDQELPPSMPLLFGFLRGDGGSPALLLKINDSKAKYSMVSTFDNMEDRTRLHTILTGIALGDGEDVIAEGLLSSASFETLDGDIKALKALEWQNFRFINYDEGDLQVHKAVLSENLRVIIDFKTGTLTDRINIEPGELKLRLSVNSQNELKVLRQPQQDLSISVSESQVSQDLPKDMEALLSAVSKAPSTRTYTFPSITQLHLFQAALTGFQVIYDGMANSFNISRRRMVVPIYKKWDAAVTRLQIVQREKVVQLVAFFENFSHGDCMNFTLKSTDTFESSGKSGKFSLRIVDAKFALPKPRVENSMNHQFACLDMPEYPGEHDDITIVFESEAEREKFMRHLPAPVKGASRMGSVRR